MSRADYFASNHFTRAQVDVLLRLLDGATSSGSYTPLADDLTNLDSVVPAIARWTRNDATVCVYVAVTVDPTAAGAADFTLSLPLTPALFTADSQLAGALANPLGEAASVIAGTGTGLARVMLTPSGTSAQLWTGSFCYPAAP